ncbi:helix-turn-helix transcriptional regulator, partial [Brachybacterium sp. Marseille-Q7125]|uniref:helix-turn-helix domain-containing protein n=1 Tax=Brachybacterium sp. Marseille-Q7125 TaxID=2932815 RepID=UPI001FF1B7D8
MSETSEAVRERAAALAETLDRLLEDLVDLREQQGLSQRDVAERMGVTQSAVSQFERYDANPTLASVRRYALAVGARISIDVAPDRSSLGLSSLRCPRGGRRRGKVLLTWKNRAYLGSNSPRSKEHLQGE